MAKPRPTVPGRRGSSLRAPTSSFGRSRASLSTASNKPAPLQTSETEGTKRRNQNALIQTRQRRVGGYRAVSREKSRGETVAEIKALFAQAPSAVDSEPPPETSQPLRPLPRLPVDLRKMGRSFFLWPSNIVRLIARFPGKRHACARCAASIFGACRLPGRRVHRLVGANDSGSQTRREVYVQCGQLLADTIE